MNINERIFSILKEKNLKQSDFAEFLGLSTGQITAWKKRGTTPPAEYLINICKFLNISIYKLLDAENENESELDKIYAKLTPEDKAIVDNIFNRYRRNNGNLSSISKIG